MIDNERYMHRGRVAVGEKPKPTKDHWQDLIHTAIIGNGRFPQSHFAQGILVAKRVAEITQEEHMPLHTFLGRFSDPPGNLSYDMYDQAKVRAHAAYGFTSKTRPAELWVRDRTAASNVTRGIAGVVLEQEGWINDADLEAVQDNPFFLDALKTAATTLVSDEVKEISNHYKARISGFMRKYPAIEENLRHIPSAYEADRQQLKSELLSTLRVVASLTKDNIVAALSDSAPHIAVGVELKTVDQLFGKIGISRIDPLHPVDPKQ